MSRELSGTWDERQVTGEGQPRRQKVKAGAAPPVLQAEPRTEPKKCGHFLCSCVLPVEAEQSAFEKAAQIADDEERQLHPSEKNLSFGELSAAANCAGRIADKIRALGRREAREGGREMNTEQICCDEWLGPFRCELAPNHEGPHSFDNPKVKYYEILHRCEHGAIVRILPAPAPRSGERKP